MFRRRFQFIIGNIKEFPLQSRIFHAVAAVVIATLFCRATYFFFTSLDVAGIACIATCAINFGLYYISRFKGKINLAVTLSALQMMGILVMNYMFNSGINGNVLLISALSLFLVILMTPMSQRIFWVALNIGIILLMMLLEYFDPLVVKQSYISRDEKFIDMGFAYVTIALLISMGIYILRKSYDQQKNLVKAHADQLQLMNNEKDKLFSIISHDLNAPMSSVKQYLNLIQAVDLDDEDRKIIQQDLSLSINEAQYLLNNLLQWAQSQLQHKRMKLSTISINCVIEDAARVFQLRAANKEIALSLDLKPELHVIADLNMLQLVLRNLLNNAIKFTHHNGKVTVSSVVAGDHVIVAISDNGIGIEEEKQAGIFGLNVVSSFGTDNEKGTGLGLMLCKDFIEQQSGKIWFDSKPLEGTTFYFSLPMAAVAVESV